MADVTRLHLSYRLRLDRIRQNTLAAVTALDGPDQAVPLVLEAQRQAVVLADTYMSLEAGLATGSSTAPWGIDPERLIGKAARRGAFLEDVYERNWAVDVGTFAQRMAREVNTDITLADRAASYVHTEGDSRIVGHRRTLGAGPNCALCVVASTQRYGKGDLRPIHYGCGCSTRPIYGDAAGWQRPNKAQLNALYTQAGGTDFRSLRRLPVNDEDLPAGVARRALPTVEVIDTDLGPTLQAVA